MGSWEATIKETFTDLPAHVTYMPMLDVRDKESHSTYIALDHRSREYGQSKTRAHTLQYVEECSSLLKEDRNF